MATDLGKVGIRMRGTWSGSTAYEVLDAVSYDNGLYIAKQAVPANTAPTNTTYWQSAVTMANIVYKDLLGNSTVTATVYKGAVIVFGRAATGKKGLAFIDSAGAVCELMSDPGITFSINGNTLTATSSLSGGVGVSIINPIQ